MQNIAWGVILFHINAFHLKNLIDANTFLFTQDTSLILQMYLPE